DRIRPDRVQINTVVRPGAEPTARPVSEAPLARAVHMLGPLAETVVRRHQRPASYPGAGGPSDILAMVQRRPCTLRDVADGLGVHPNKAAKQPEALLGAGHLRTEVKGGVSYYVASEELCRDFAQSWPLEQVRPGAAERMRTASTEKRLWKA
ncbi:MAG: hypothetical protein ACE5JM_12890, partial [Armatimonadota bacterium]